MEEIVGSVVGTARRCPPYNLLRRSAARQRNRRALKTAPNEGIVPPRTRNGRHQPWNQGPQAERTLSGGPALRIVGVIIIIAIAYMLLFTLIKFDIGGPLLHGLIGGGTVWAVWTLRRPPPPRWPRQRR